MTRNRKILSTEARAHGSTPTPIRRRDDGSIDLAHHIERGRDLRSRDAHAWLARLRRALKRRGSPRPLRPVTA
ncbi:MAG TPA: hypothetical protein QF665_02310 [Alphaproteobacteria bacterium]|jgi:hypothetical protein|nr:hypothetical protein [Alphaproteobacteria bacterium]